MGIQLLIDWKFPALFFVRCNLCNFLLEERLLWLIGHRIFVGANILRTNKVGWNVQLVIVFCCILFALFICICMTFWVCIFVFWGLSKVGWGVQLMIGCFQPNCGEISGGGMPQMSYRVLAPSSSSLSLISLSSIVVTTSSLSFSLLS